MNEGGTFTTFPGQFGNQTGMKRGLCRSPEGLLDLGHRESTQTKHRCHCKVGMHLRQSLMGKRENRHWEIDEMRWFTQLATEGISRMLKSLTSLISLRILGKESNESTQSNTAGRTPRGPPKQLCDWDHPAGPNKAN